MASSEYKVVTVVVQGYQKTNTFEEFEFPIVNSHLEAGYTIKEVHQSVASSSSSIGSVVLTFILYKRDTF